MIINDSKAFCCQKPTAVALGIFDGVHIGHKAVLETAVEMGKRLGAKPAVFTFGCGEMVSKGRPDAILSEKAKRAKLSSCGIEVIYSAEFEKMRGLSPREFVRDVLLGQMGAACVVCGENFHFGKGGKADSQALKTLCGEYGIEVCVIKRVESGEQPVSSTRIRQLIRDGKISEANRLLGGKFGYTLPVVHGNEIGRTWDFPTINQQIPKGLILPKFAVYCAKVLIDGKRLSAVANIGVKPTVGGQTQPLAETYIIGFDGNLYGREITLELYEFVRAERTFSSFDELKAEIARNTEFTIKYFERTDTNEQSQN